MDGKTWRIHPLFSREQSQSRLVVRFRHSHLTSAGLFANVGVKRPPAIVGFKRSLGFDIRVSRAFAELGSVRSTPLASPFHSCRGSVIGKKWNLRFDRFETLKAGA
jgi:hypothetical protein